MRYLYVIGNGFDIAHGIKSGYSHYKEWLKDNNKSLFDQLNAAYNDDEAWWGNFEENLSTIDVDKYKAYNISNYKGVTERELFGTMESIRWCPTASQISDLYKRMIDSFDNWVSSLRIGKQKRKFKLKKRSAFFLTFNYTNTLEVLYKVPKRKVFHIHGQANSNEKLVLGHGMDENMLFDLYKRKHGFSDDYELDEDTQNVIDQVARLHKPVRCILFKNRKRFETLVNVKRINIIGFSFSEIDMDYLDWVVEHHKQINGVKWKVTWHTEEDKIKIQSFFEKHHIHTRNYKLVRK